MSSWEAGRGRGGDGEDSSAVGLEKLVSPHPHAVHLGQEEMV